MVTIKESLLETPKINTTSTSTVKCFQTFNKLEQFSKIQNIMNSREMFDFADPQIQSTCFMLNIKQTGNKFSKLGQCELCISKCM